MRQETVKKKCDLLVETFYLYLNIIQFNQEVFVISYIKKCDLFVKCQNIIYQQKNTFYFKQEVFFSSYIKVV